jgi:hypothetical protein
MRIYSHASKIEYVFYFVKTTACPGDHTVTLETAVQTADVTIEQVVPLCRFSGVFAALACSTCYWRS